MQVSEHKTVREHGPARFCLTQDLYKQYTLYGTKFRMALYKKQKSIPEYFFLTWNGEKMSSDMVIKCIIIWVNMGLID